MVYPQIPAIPNNPAMSQMAEILPGIVYSSQTGTPLTLHILTPWRRQSAEHEPAKHPLIVFIQGCAWTSPNINYEIPQLSEYAKKGYIVATVSHRNCLEGHPFPAFLQDVKTAVRFLRAHAEKYGIDPERVAAFGSSSGGNIALLLGVTGDDPQYRTSEYADFSDSVKAVVDCFGPTDLTAMADAILAANPNAHESQEGVIFLSLCGNSLSGSREILKTMSPYHLLEEEKEYPPFFLLHGDADLTVPYSQSESMYHKLLDYRADARMLRVTGGAHEESFWSREVHDRILDFLKETL